ncbi:hypothetical protein TRKP33_p0017 (plasmid) [Klebsiella pneumoniae]|uniref:Uncharacterized protein n=3 Tax=Klebsiella TaxID=570 RepID=A0A1Z3MLT5_KLEOX|nr:hypothetical protein [Klebsiella oxytoca]AVX35199.1 Hypothetical protein [Klebsiella aerogenes]QVQ58419.1 hypothetical protein [Klebsiella pneumoniae]UMW89630.1 hypothetical protein [Klebsiella pneumoniae]URH11049.1 hypothetical protein [Klebsiella pneumoniae]
MTINSSRLPAGFCLISNQERWVYHFPLSVALNSKCLEKVEW